MTDEALAAAVLAVLRPTGLRARVRLALGGGYTALQVWERLDADIQADLGAADVEPTVAARLGVERVQRALLALAAAGQARHKRVGMTMTLNTKGPRDVLVDVFRAI
ncbi:MAG: hypothetical protein Q8P41_08040 [Pseudomonadota bacterium]|nr:hypothetical protein [Pseudomonadota bacterium]